MTDKYVDINILGLSIMGSRGLVPLWVGLREGAASPCVSRQSPHFFPFLV